MGVLTNKGKRHPTILALPDAGVYHIELDNSGGQRLGLELDGSTGKKLLVKSIVGGLIQQWNAEHQEDRGVFAGDYILSVDSVCADAAELLRALQKKGTMRVVLMCGDIPASHAAAASSKPSATLANVPIGAYQISVDNAYGERLGLELEACWDNVATTELEVSSGTSLLIKSIIGGLVQQWNAEHEDLRSVCVGDSILAVGSVVADARALLRALQQKCTMRITLLPAECQSTPLENPLQTENYVPTDAGSTESGIGSNIATGMPTSRGLSPGECSSPKSSLAVPANGDITETGTPTSFQSTFTVPSVPSVPGIRPCADAESDPEGGSFSQQCSAVPAEVPVGDLPGVDAFPTATPQCSLPVLHEPDVIREEELLVAPVELDSADHLREPQEGQRQEELPEACMPTSSLREDPPLVREESPANMADLDKEVVEFDEKFEKQTKRTLKQLEEELPKILPEAHEESEAMTTQRQAAATAQAAQGDLQAAVAQAVEERSTNADTNLVISTTLPSASAAQVDHIVMSEHVRMSSDVRLVQAKGLSTSGLAAPSFLSRVSTPESAKLGSPCGTVDGSAKANGVMEEAAAIDSRAATAQSSIATVGTDELGDADTHNCAPPPIAKTSQTGYLQEHAAAPAEESTWQVPEDAERIESPSKELVDNEVPEFMDTRRTKQEIHVPVENPNTHQPAEGTQEGYAETRQPSSGKKKKKKGERLRNPDTKQPPEVEHRSRPIISNPGSRMSACWLTTYCNPCAAPVEVIPVTPRNSRD